MISVQQAKKDYVWQGDSFIAMHEIGPYEIVEFWRANHDHTDDDKRRSLAFGTYIQGKRMGQSYPSLDEALAGCISRRHEGLNNHGDHYFIRMIGANLSEVREGSPAGTCDQCQEVVFNGQKCSHCAHRSAA